jgi:apolipoprotein D and lipocalin family protein
MYNHGKEAAAGRQAPRSGRPAAAGLLFQLAVIAAIFSLCAACRPETPGMPPETVAHVDLDRYLGTWYEIARIPNRFQRHCSHAGQAEYRDSGAGRIAVTNRCIRRDGSLDEVSGIARVTDPASNARLQVSFVRVFGIQLFWGEYWIIGLDPGYRFAVVGHPRREYGWILSRTAQPEPGVLARARDILREQGYDPDDFVVTGPGAAAAAAPGAGGDDQ